MSPQATTTVCVIRPSYKIITIALLLKLFSFLPTIPQNGYSLFLTHCFFQVLFCYFKCLCFALAQESICSISYSSETCGSRSCKDLPRITVISLLHEGQFPPGGTKLPFLASGPPGSNTSAWRPGRAGST